MNELGKKVSITYVNRASLFSLKRISQTPDREGTEPLGYQHPCDSFLNLSDVRFPYVSHSDLELK